VRVDLISRPAVLVFFVVVALLAVLQGNRFVLTNDEGILLEPARQVASGQRPYVDFFGYMSPGSYWIQAAWFKILGVSLWAGRLPVIIGFALQCALLFWLTARLASRRAALAAVIIFTGFQVADPAFLTAQHRWDSGTLALAGICAAIRWPSAGGLVLSGALLAAAAWCTPSMVLVAGAVGLWLCLARERRRLLLPLGAGIAGVTILALGSLALQGSLSAFIQQMFWLQRNYAAVNVMPYGSVNGGYGRLVEDTAGLERCLRILFIGCLALPAILPPAALLLWSAMYWRRRAPLEMRAEVILLALASVALVLTAFPRADLFHLAFVAALPYALVAAALAHLLSVRAGAILAFTFIPLAGLFSLNNVIAAFDVQPVASPVGKLRAPAGLAPDLVKLMRQVGPSQTLFVYPYMPIFYFATQARNPSHFSFLAPGMMTKAEETAALNELQAHPPEWLLNMPLSQEEFSRIFPNANGASARFEALEAWLAENYAPVEQSPVNLNGYRLWHILKKGG
jgi:4-amino-4-deoxy-L-arabinose transferase-like glycosyltransferase